MQCRTHIALGIALNMAIFQANDYKTLLITLAGATIGGSIPDLDSYNSESSQILNKVTITILATVFLCIILNYAFGINILNKIVQYKNLTNILVGLLLFIFVSLLGSLTKHRTFTHSITCIAIYYVVLSTFLSNTFTIPFSLGMLSHIFLDLFNHVGVGLLCPFVDKRFCLNLCDSDGLVNSILFYASVFAIAYIYVLTF